MCGKKVLDTKNYKQTSVWRRDDQFKVNTMKIKAYVKHLLLSVFFQNVL